MGESCLSRYFFARLSLRNSNAPISLQRAAGFSLRGRLWWEGASIAFSWPRGLKPAARWGYNTGASENRSV